MLLRVSRVSTSCYLHLWQVAVQCAERASLLTDIWQGYSSMADAVNGALLVCFY